MARPMEQRLELYSISDVECAHALWRIELVPRDGEEIHAKIADPRRNLADRLGGIGVEQ
jgi:hypothetical protein